MSNTNEFLNVNEIAEFLRLPRSTVYKLCQDKVLPAFKIGKHWRLRKETFYEWLSQQEQNILTGSNHKNKTQSTKDGTSNGR